MKSSYFKLFELFSSNPLDQEFRMRVKDFPYVDFGLGSVGQTNSPS